MATTATAKNAAKKSAVKQSTSKSSTKSTTKRAAKKSVARSSAKTASTYTEPELRERLKEEIKAGDKGGKPGQWSARKAQLLVHEYEKAGGGYINDGALTETQKHLKQWTAEEWQTSDGSTEAENPDGTMNRYLPKQAWDKLTPAEKAATNRRKRQASK